MNNTIAYGSGLKRAYQSDEPQTIQAYQSNSTTTNSPPLSSASATSAFRNVSACNRCRVRKNRCDQNLPACSACAKANVKCVGYDPITKREIPRSYVYYLESRLAYFESLLLANGIHFNQPEAFDADSKGGNDALQSPRSEHPSEGHGETQVQWSQQRHNDEGWSKKQEDADKLENLVSNIGLVSVRGASDPRYLGSTSGISFARVVFAAVKSSVSTSNSERSGMRPSKPLANINNPVGSSMRDSYFGLQTRPTIKPAPFPDRELGSKLAHLYFEHANPQIPILHRGEFMEMFDKAYSKPQSQRTSRELYMLNIIFAIGSGIIWGSSDPQKNTAQHSDYGPKRTKIASQQSQPEEYHASAIVHLESFLGSTTAIDKSDGFGGGLEELQAVLLLAGFALLRPVAPGLWYIVGVAVRLGVDLGLHYEDGSGIEVANGTDTISSSTRDMAMDPSIEGKPTSPLDAKERGRREWVRDLRRRLWWCIYTFDRLVSTCVGRPFGITDQVVTTEFPSLLDDDYITRSGFVQPPAADLPSYKHVAHHYFRLRLLQSEILQVLQYQQAQIARQSGANMKNEFMHTKLPSPFLVSFDSFRSWRKDIDRRLWEWKESAPDQKETGVAFSIQFLELNYWQAVIMLYRQSLSTPGPLAGESSPTEGVASPSSPRIEEKEDEDDVFLKCAEAGQKTLKLYRQLHRLRLVNYTYLATHHLFMAGISFLYAVWHSPVVRSRLTLDDVDFTVLAATSVLDDLMEKCPPAEACRDAFQRMSKATVQMCMSTTGFGFGKEPELPLPRTRPSFASTMSNDNISIPIDPVIKQEPQQQRHRPLKSKRPPPKFDMDLRELFPEDMDQSSLLSQSFPRDMPPPPPPQRIQTPQQQQSPSAAPTLSTIRAQTNAGFGMDASVMPASASGLPAFTASPPQQMPFYDNNSFQPDFGGMDFNNDDFMADSVGIDLGGFGMDFQHDWSEGQQFDLFDGFFFGNQ